MGRGWPAQLLLPLLTARLPLPTARLPACAAGSEPEPARALRADEARCYTCSRCGDGGGCPSRVGVWYVDTFTTTLPGCNATRETRSPAQAEGGEGAVPPYRPSVVINWNTSVEVAKFEVCQPQPPGCYNVSYEAEKARRAKRCSNSVCPQ